MSGGDVVSKATRDRDVARRENERMREDETGRDVTGRDGWSHSWPDDGDDRKMKAKELLDLPIKRGMATAAESEATG